MKCIPTTFAGLPLTSARIPIGILEVFEAKMVSSLQTFPKFMNNVFLISTFSIIASIIISESLKSSISKVVPMFPSVLSISS